MVRHGNTGKNHSSSLNLAPNGLDEAAFEQAMLERWPRLAPTGIALRLGITALLFFSTWRAIQYRGATALSLLLPMVAELMVAILAGVLLAIFVVRDMDFRRQVWSGLRPWALVVVGVLIWQAWQGHHSGDGFAARMDLAWNQIYGFAVSSGLRWSMLIAALGFGGGVLNDIAAYRRNGPPFVYLGSLNFGLRALLMLMFGFWLASIAFAFDFSRRQNADAMWIALLLAELLALWLPAAVQAKMRAARENQRGPGKVPPSVVRSE